MDASGWDRAYSAREGVRSTEPRPAVVEHVSALEPGRAIDLGAGEGRNAFWLAEGGWRVTAVDFSHVALEAARRRAESGGIEMEYEVADVCEYVPEAQAFDLVLISYVHPEPPDRDAMLAAAASAVAPGGYLLVLGLGLSEDMGTGGPDPERRYTPERIAGAFPGIHLDRCERVTREIETDDGPREAADVLAWGWRPIRPERTG